MRMTSRWPSRTISTAASAASGQGIQRDIESLRAFLENEHSNQTVVYDKRLGGYRVDTQAGKLTNGEILAVCKILLESRSLPKKDMDELLAKLLQWFYL